MTNPGTLRPPPAASPPPAPPRPARRRRRTWRHTLRRDWQLYSLDNG
ncbi:hypothetical protein [Micromonospora chersina]